MPSSLYLLKHTAFSFLTDQDHMCFLSPQETLVRIELPFFPHMSNWTFPPEAFRTSSSWHFLLVQPPGTCIDLLCATYEVGNYIHHVTADVDFCPTS